MRLTMDELIDREARALARETIRTELERQNLPLPKESSMDVHITALLTANPRFLEAARDRVNAKKDAYTESLQSIGLGSAALDIDL